MRVAFIVPRFGTDAPTGPERIAEELAKSGSRDWLLNILTLAHGVRDGRPLKAGMHSVGRVRIHRFAPDGEPTDSPDQLTSAALLQHLKDETWDVVLLFGANPVICRDAVRVAAERTVLMPFTDDQPVEDAAEVFEGAGAFLFGNEAEEVRVLRTYGVHRRMRETINTGFLLPRDLDPDGFREWAGIRGRHLLCLDSAESNRVVQEFVRLFQAFRDSHPRARLDLVVLGSPPPDLARRPDTRFVVTRNERERLDAIAGAFMVVMPERLTSVAATAEPFSMGVPILVHASAGNLVAECKESNGGLYYRDYSELELILELGLREPELFQRLGEAGRSHLLARNDWQALVARYDRAFRSFARPSRFGEDGPPPTASGPAGAESAPEAAVAPEVRDSEGEAPSSGTVQAAPQPDSAGDGSGPEARGESVVSLDTNEEGEEEGLSSFFRGSIHRD